MIVIGINAYHGDVSSVFLRQGRLVAAVEEERSTRVKHWARVPQQSTLKCREIAGVDARDIDALAVSRNQKAHAVRKALFALRHRPRLSRDRARNWNRLGRLPETLAKLVELPPATMRERTHWIETLRDRIRKTGVLGAIGAGICCLGLKRLVLDGLGCIRPSSD